MASDKPQSEILDLLYDDELDEETRAAARRNVEQSDEAREELEGFESMLAKIREVDLDEDVPASVHDSIMASARKHAADKASRQAQVTRRPPTAPKPTENSLWSRLNSSGVSQLVLAAAVVLVGGFIFIKIGADEAPNATFTAANEAVEQEVTFGNESSDKFAKGAPEPETTEPAPGEVAQAPADDLAKEGPQRPGLDQPSADQPKSGNQTGRQADRDSASKKSKLGELAQLDKRAEAEAPRPESGRERRTRSVKKRRSRKSATRKKDSADDLMELFGSSSRPSANTKKSRPAPQPAEQEEKEAKLDDVLAGTDSTSSSSRSSSASNSRAADNAGLGESLGALADSSDDSDAPSSASGAVAKTENKPVPTQANSDQEQTSSVNTMEANYRSGNFAGVVAQADRYLARSSGDQADEARVLELKARALARQGKASEADDVYAELQKKYPSYKADQIRRERADLTKERKSKAKRRRQAPAAEASDKPQYDMESQEAAEPQPSSIDRAY